jgi:hypothetical protein
LGPDNIRLALSVSSYEQHGFVSDEGLQDTGQPAIESGSSRHEAAASSRQVDPGTGGGSVRRFAGAAPLPDIGNNDIAMELSSSSARLCTSTPTDTERDGEYHPSVGLSRVDTTSLPAWQLHDDEVDNSLFVRTRVRDHDDEVCSSSTAVQAILLARSGMHVRVMKVGSHEAPGRRLVV